MMILSARCACRQRCLAASHLTSICAKWIAPASRSQNPATMRSLLQYTLDLFDLEPRVPPVPARPKPAGPKPARPRKIKENQAPALVPVKDSATEFVANDVIEGPVQPARPLSDVLVPVNFRHPRANRETRLGGAVVAFEFKRGKRRTMMSPHARSRLGAPWGRFQGRVPA